MDIPKALQKLVEQLPEYEFSDDLLIEAVRAGVGVAEWINATREEREEFKRVVYRALKELAGVQLPEDSLTREDLDMLRKAVTIISGYVEEYRGLQDAVDLIEKAMAQ